MRKLILLLTILVLACGFADIPLLAQPAASETPAPVVPPPPTNTPQPPIPPTHTYTPTLIGAQPSFTPIDSGTSTALIFWTTTATPTSTSLTPDSFTSQPGLAGTGFNSITLSTDEFHWGSCDPGMAALTAHVTNASEVFSVVLFVRFRNKSTGDVTGWDDGTAMNNEGGGTFDHTFDGSKMEIYADTWVVYQLIGTDVHSQNVARSPVFSESLSLSPCP